MNPFEFGELLLAVHAERFPLFVRLRGDDFDAGFERALDDIGEIELALRVVVFQRCQPFAELRGRRNDDARIDLGDRQLAGIGVFLLDNALHRARRIAHDAAVPGRIVQRDRQDAIAAAGAASTRRCSVLTRVSGTSP